MPEFVIAENLYLISLYNMSILFFKDKYLVFSGYEFVTVIITLIIIIYIIRKLYIKRNEPIMKYYDVYNYMGTLSSTLCGSLIMIFVYLFLNIYTRHKISTILDCCKQ
jgi:hypothetical protein